MALHGDLYSGNVCGAICTLTTTGMKIRSLRTASSHSSNPTRRDEGKQLRVKNLDLSHEAGHQRANTRRLRGGAQVFEQFLAGDTLQECYAAVGAVANRWLDLLDTQANPSPPVSILATCM